MTVTINTAIFFNIGESYTIVDVRVTDEGGRDKECPEYLFLLFRLVELTCVVPSYYIYRDYVKHIIKVGGLLGNHTESPS